MSSTSVAPAKVPQKKRGKKEAPAAVISVDSISPLPTGGSTHGGETEAMINGDGSHESSYIKDLQRNVRNVTKKLAAMQKVDSVVAENPGISLDELVASRKINNDQKAQALKKPSLHAQLAQYEEQIASYRKLEEEFQVQATKEKEALQEAHEAEIAALQSKWEAESKIGYQKDVRKHLLTLSTFLRAAAARRQVEDDASEDSKAFEGMLLLLYGGDLAAVDAAEKLIYGSRDGVSSTEGQLLNVSYGRVRELSGEVAPPNTEEVVTGNISGIDGSTVSTEETAMGDVGTDPTIAHAGLTELDDIKPMAQIDETNAGPEQAGIDEGAANAAATSNWEKNISPTGDGLQDSWVSVPRPADETEAPIGSAAANGTENLGNKAAGWGQGSVPTNSGTTAVNGTSWADDTPDVHANDGFREVSHHNRGNRGRGGQAGGQEGRAGGRGGRGSGRGGGRGGERRGGERRGGERGRGGGRGRGGCAQEA